MDAATSALEAQALDAALAARRRRESAEAERLAQEAQVTDAPRLCPLPARSGAN